MADFQLNVKLNGVDKVVSTVGQIQQALKQTREELKGVELGGAAFEKLTLQARNLQRELKDVKESTNFELNIGQSVEAVARLGSTITSSFAIATSAISLFGGEGKDISEEAVKAQQALSIAIAATTLAGNAQRIMEDLGNAGKLVQTGLVKLITLLTSAHTEAVVADTIATEGLTAAELAKTAAESASTGSTIANTVATEASAIAEGELAVATGGATIAQRALNLAMSANPIGLLVAAAATLATAFVLLSEDEVVATKAIEGFNEAIDESTKTIDIQIQKQKELVKAQGTLNEILAKGELGKLSARLDTQRQLGKLDEEDLANQKAALDQKLVNQKTELDAVVKLNEQKLAESLKVENLMSATTTIGVNAVIDANKQKYENELNAILKKKSLIDGDKYTQEQFYIELLSLQKTYYKSADEEDKKAFDKKSSESISFFQQQLVIAGQQKALSIQQTADEAAAQVERNKINAAATKARVDAESKYNSEIDRLTRIRINAQLDAERSIQDAALERISLLQGADGVYRENIIAGYTEEIAKLQVLRTRDLQDAITVFEAQLDKNKQLLIEFKGTNQKKIDYEKELTKTAEAELDARGKKTKIIEDQIVRQTEERAAKVIEIEKILGQELTYGDQNLNDSRIQLQLDTLKFQEDIASRRIALTREQNIQVYDIELKGLEVLLSQLLITQEQYELRRKELLTGRAIAEDASAKNILFGDIQLIRERGKLQIDALKSQRDAANQNLDIEFQDKIKVFNFSQKEIDRINKSGSDDEKKNLEQSNIQKTRLEEKYRQDKLKINEDYALKEVETEKAASQAILNAKVAKLQEYAQLAGQFATGALAIAQQITEGERIEGENRMRQNRDDNANKQSELNIAYQNDVIALQEQLRNKTISEAQYNTAVKGLDKALSDDKKKLANDMKAFDNKEKKAAFDRDKKLKIGQAVIAGAQGAISAFAGAMTLGPIAGPIVGGILAAAVVAATGIQISNIKKTQYDGGAPEITQPEIPSTSVPSDNGGNAPNSANQLPSSGGYTAFNPNLLVPTQGGPGGKMTGTGGTNDPLRVYVLESDITNTQTRVSVAESNATF